MKKIFLLMLIFSASFSYAQRGVVSGYVMDMESKERLIGAVVENRLTKDYIITDDNGSYILFAKKGEKVSLICRYPGYEPMEVTFVLDKDTTVNFSLSLNNSIDSILVKSTTPEYRRKQISANYFNLRNISLLPSIGSEIDIMKVINLFPGVIAQEGNSSLSVRGGSIDENLILMDGVPIYYVGHLGGLLSIFNSDIIKDVKLIKGGFPSHYTGRLSSVIDIRLKDGDMQENRNAYQIGLLSSKFYSEGPLIRRKWSYVFSFRFMPWSYLIYPLQKKFVDVGILYNFNDINLKLNWISSHKNRVVFGFYNGGDILKSFLHFDTKKLKGNYKIGYDNFFIYINDYYRLGQRLYMKTFFNIAQYKFGNSFYFNNQYDTVLYQYNFSNRINDINYGFTFRYMLSSHYTLYTGSKITSHSFMPGESKYFYKHSFMLIDTSLILDNIKPIEFNYFIENHLTTEKVSANLGLNFSLYKIGKITYKDIEPRLSISFINGKSSLKLGYATMQQYFHLLSNSNIGFPMDMWVLSDTVLVPSKASQLDIGIYSHYDNWDFSIIGYYKKMKDLITYKEGTNLGRMVYNWKDKIEIGGKGVAYGFEVMVERKTSRMHSWVAYTYSRSLREFVNINRGQIYPFKYDSPHKININFVYKFSPKLSFSAVWIYHTGFPFTMPLAKFNIIDIRNSFYQNSPQDYGRTVFIYSDRNSFRMRDYHRLDIGLVYTKKRKKGTIIQWRISIYNLYNRQNPYFYYFVQKDSHLIMRQQSLFPFFPSVAYYIKW